MKRMGEKKGDEEGRAGRGRGGEQDKIAQMRYVPPPFFSTDPGRPALIGHNLWDRPSTLEALNELERQVRGGARADGWDPRQRRCRRWRLVALREDGRRPSSPTLLATQSLFLYQTNQSRLSLLFSIQACFARAYRRVWEGEKIGWTHDRPGGSRARGRRWRRGSLLGSGSGARPSLEPRREEEELELKLLSSSLAGPWWVGRVGCGGCLGVVNAGVLRVSFRPADWTTQKKRTEPAPPIKFSIFPKLATERRTRLRSESLSSLVLNCSLSLFTLRRQGEKSGRSVIARSPP